MRIGFGKHAVICIIILSIATVTWWALPSAIDNLDHDLQKPSPLPKPKNRQHDNYLNHGSLAAVLNKHNWTQEAIQKVVNLVTATWTEPNAEWVKQHPYLVGTLAGLASIPKAVDLIERRPEISFMLAGAKDPECVTEVFYHLDDYEYFLVEGMFKRYSSPDDYLHLIVALRRHDFNKAMISLAKLGLTGAEALFLHSSDPNFRYYDDNYNIWLIRTVEDYLITSTHLDEETKASVLTFLLFQGPAIRSRMNDAEFALQFECKLWPRFKDLGPPHEWYLYAGVPQIWDILAYSSGVEMIRHYHMLPMVLLDSADGLPKRHHPFVVQVLSSGRDTDDAVAGVLELCRKEQDFYLLLDNRHNISHDAFMGIVYRLLDLSGDNPHSQQAYSARRRELDKIAVWLRRNNFSAIESEYAGVSPPLIVKMIPGYGIYNLFDKLLDGRDITQEDVSHAVGEMAFWAKHLRGLMARSGRIMLSHKDTKAKRLQRLRPKLSKNSTVMADYFKLLSHVENEYKDPTVLMRYISECLISTLVNEREKRHQRWDISAAQRVLAYYTGVGLPSVRKQTSQGWQFFVDVEGRTFAVFDLNKINLPEQLRSKLSMSSTSWEQNTCAWWIAQLLINKQQ